MCIINVSVVMYIQVYIQYCGDRGALTKCILLYHLTLNPPSIIFEQCVYTKAVSTSRDAYIFDQICFTVARKFRCHHGKCNSFTASNDFLEASIKVVYSETCQGNYLYRATTFPSRPPIWGMSWSSFLDNAL